MIIREHPLPMMAIYDREKEIAYFSKGYYLANKNEATKMLHALINFYSSVSDEDIEKENKRLCNEISADRFVK